jgi:hypothetical protein
MNKIIIYLIFICLLIVHTTSGQVTMTVNIAYPAPAYLSDWNNSRAGLVTVILNSGGKQETGLIKFRTELQNSNGGVIAISNISTARVYTIRSGANTFTLDKVLQLENLQFENGVIANKIQTSGKLPSDTYTLCIQLISGTNDAVLTREPVCRPFTQISFQLPFLLAPNDKTWLDANIAQSVITFRWSSLVPMSKEPVFYRLQVFEVLDGQQPMQALRSNQPILETEVRGTTQYFWRPQLSFKDNSGHVFIWTVQTLDAKGTPVSSVDENNQGRSEPHVFGVCDRSKQDKSGTGEDCAEGRKL